MTDRWHWRGHKGYVFQTEEQEKPNPNNALIAVLCDAVRLLREAERSATAPVGAGTPVAAHEARSLSCELRALRQFAELADGSLAPVHADEFEDLEPAAQALQDYAGLVEGLEKLMASATEREAESCLDEESSVHGLYACALRQLLAGKS